MKPGILYISYDGMLEPLGQSQVLSYLEQLAGDYRIYLISFEKKEDWRDPAKRQAVTARIAAAGMVWKPLRYHKSPTAPATAFDIAAGTAAALRIAITCRVSIVHARSYVAAVMALAVKRLTGARFLFDMRGLWADERVDGGLWPAASRLYKAAKQLERRFLLTADHVVTLTHASLAELQRFDYLKDKSPPISVIPTCVDLEKFAFEAAPAPKSFVMGYVGSIGTWYLFDEMLACFRAVLRRQPEARLLVINRNEHALVRERITAAGIDPDLTEIVAAGHDEVAAHIRRMTVGTAIIKPSYSKIASAPTKLAEYLACGVPCLGNVDVGDMERILEGEKVGVALRGFSTAEIAAAADRLLVLLQDKTLAHRCSETAQRLFSLELGVAGYRAIYERLSGEAVAKAHPRDAR
jgi:glycosyltransferase involved in cell wall biosynthesis